MQVFVEEDAVLEWRRYGYKVEERYKSGAVRMKKRETYKNGSYVWTHEDKEELKMLLSKLNHLTYQQIHEYYIPERSPDAIRAMAYTLNLTPRVIPARVELDERKEIAYLEYMNNPDATISEIVKKHFPDVPYVNARQRFYRYIVKKTASKKKSPR